MSAAERLLARIRAEGPIPLADFMAEAVTAYYRRPRVFGAAGDFVTAPEVSQIFGELIGLWLALRWRAMEAPSRVILAECGPGRGALIADALRAAALVPGFDDAVDLHLVETSPLLRETQRRALGGRPATWHDGVATLPEDAPLLLLGNEFLDALPIRQAVFRQGRWRERCVGHDGRDFVFADGAARAPDAEFLAALPPPAEGDVLEDGPAALAFAAEVAARILRQGGAALLFDYGHTTSGYGETLQAVSRHHFAPPLSRPGETDLTAHVDFARLAAAARAAGAAVFGPAEQGLWLVAMGLPARLTVLLRQATPQQSADLISGTQRLIEPQAMGRLFKAIAFLPPGVAAPEGF